MIISLTAIDSYGKHRTYKNARKECYHTKSISNE